MRAEAVIVFHLQPTRHAEPDRPTFSWANAIPPMIMVGVAATRPAQERHRQRLQRLEHIATKAILMGDFALARTDPQALVTAAPKVLGEMAVQPG